MSVNRKLGRAFLYCSLITSITGIVNQQNFFQQMFRRSIDHTPNGSHQNRPGFVMEYDNYGRFRQIRRIFYVDTSVWNRGDSGSIYSRITKKIFFYNFLRTSGKLRFNGIRSLAIKLNRFIWNFCCIRSTSFAGTITGFPLSPSPDTGAKSLWFSASKFDFLISLFLLLKLKFPYP